MRVYLFIFILFISCSKEVTQKVDLIRDISIKLDSSKKEITLNKMNSKRKIIFSNKLKTSKDKIIFPKYKFKNDIVKFKIKSEQLFDSNLNSFILTLKLTLNFKLSSYDKEKDERVFDIYISDFSFEEKNLKGELTYKNIAKKYETLFKSTHFTLKMDSYGKKEMIIPNKISYNPHLKKMSGFIFNLIENIFFTFTPEVENKFVVERKKYILKEIDEKKDIIIEKKRFDISQVNNNDNILINGKNEKTNYYFLFSKKIGLPIQINYLIKDSYGIKLDNKKFNYKIKNYYFIRKL